MLFVFATNQAFAFSVPKQKIQFIPNKGQWENNVLYKADLPIGHLFVERTRITYLFTDKEAAHLMQHGTVPQKLHMHSVRVNFSGASELANIKEENKSETYYNYFLGDASKHVAGVHGYEKLVFENLYQGIDLELAANGMGLKINFIVGAQANPNLISLMYEGASSLELKNKQLHITTSLGNIIEDEPISYQMYNGSAKNVSTRFSLKGNIVTFKLGNYDKSKPLVIDPEVVFGTFMGSAADNFGFAASYDVNGNALGAGTVYAANFPTTTGAFDVSFAGGSGNNGEYARDAFIAKFSPNGSSLVFATFLGGSDNEQPHSVSTVANSGDIVVFGTTYSPNFPTTPVAHDRTYNGGADVFICRINAAGNTLLASTFLGGTNDDGINGTANTNYSAQPHELPYNYADWFRGEVIIDLAGNIIVTTCTKSTHLQSIPLINAAQPIYGGAIRMGLLPNTIQTLARYCFQLLWEEMEVMHLILFVLTNPTSLFLVEEQPAPT